MSEKRSTTGKAAVPYYPGTSDRELAKYLRLVAGRFLNDRANAGDVDKAVKLWVERKTTS